MPGFPVGRPKLANANPCRLMQNTQGYVCGGTRAITLTAILGGGTAVLNPDGHSWWWRGSAEPPAPARAWN